MTQIAPKPIFDGVKEWPAAAPAAAVMGHNRPPPEEMVVIEFNDALDGKEGFRARIATLIEKGLAPPECADADMAGRLGDYIRMVAAAQTFIDDQRMLIKAPYLAATRAIDNVAKSLADHLGEGKTRAKAKIDAYVAEIARQQREEAKRIADEQARLRRVAEEQAAAERAAAARDGAEAPPAPPPEQSPPQAPAAPIAPPKAPLIRGDLGASIGMKTVKVVTIADVKKLPKAILNHPKVHEAVIAVVNARIRGGETDIAGVVITETQVANVR